MEHVACFFLAFGGAFLGGFLAVRFQIVAPKQVAPVVKRAPTYNTPQKAATYLKGVEDAAIPRTWIRKD